MTERKFFTIAETAEILRVSRMTVNRRLRDGTIKKIKIGKRVLIPASFFVSLIKK
jgi:excisionase family DNA binding protein